MASPLVGLAMLVMLARLNWQQEANKATQRFGPLTSLGSDEGGGGYAHRDGQRQRGGADGAGRQQMLIRLGRRAVDSSSSWQQQRANSCWASRGAAQRSMGQLRICSALMPPLCLIVDYCVDYCLPPDYLPAILTFSSGQF